MSQELYSILILIVGHLSDALIPMMFLIKDVPFSILIAHFKA